MILDVHAELLSLSLQHTVAEKVELDLLVLPPPVTVLAVDDSGLLRMKLQSAFGKATPDGVQHRSCFLLAPSGRLHRPRTARTGRSDTSVASIGRTRSAG